jgi:hypothetical protein
MLSGQEHLWAFAEDHSLKSPADSVRGSANLCDGEHLEAVVNPWANFFGTELWNVTVLAWLCDHETVLL